jgi:hypothetical protein
LPSGYFIDFLRGEKFMTSKTGHARLLISALAAVAAVVCSQSPALSADLVGGYSALAQARQYREVRDCQLLRTTDPDGSRVVEVCFKPIF